MRDAYTVGTGKILKTCLDKVSMSAINCDSPSVQSHLTMLQAIISRMASNSASCKTWCITLVSAMVIVLVDKKNPNYLLVTVIPVGLFFLLDSYYLGLEKQFRDSYDNFIRKIHSSKIQVGDLFIMSPQSSIWDTLSSIKKAAKSPSVWPFYLLLSVMLLLVGFLMSPSGMGEIHRLQR